MVGVNRALIRFCPSSQARDSGLDTLQKKKKMKSKQKELNEHPITGSDLAIGSGNNGVLQGHLVTRARNVFTARRHCLAHDTVATCHARSRHKCPTLDQPLSRHKVSVAT